MASLVGSALAAVHLRAVCSQSGRSGFSARHALFLCGRAGTSQDDLRQPLCCLASCGTRCADTAAAHDGLRGLTGSPLQASQGRDSEPPRHCRAAAPRSRSPCRNQGSLQSLRQAPRGLTSTRPAAVARASLTARHPRSPLLLVLPSTAPTGLGVAWRRGRLAKLRAPRASSH